MPAKISAYDRASRAGVSWRPSRPGSSPTAISRSRTAFSTASASYRPGCGVASVIARSLSARGRGRIIGRGLVHVRGRDPIHFPVRVEIGGLGVDLRLQRHLDRREVRDGSFLAREPDLASLALDDRGEDLRELRLVERLLLQKRGDQGVEHRAVVGEHLPRLVARCVDERAHLAVDRCGDRFRVVPLVPHVAAEEHLTPSRTEPMIVLMPYSVTILRAIPVAFSMSFEAPVVGSWKTSSSATRPPSANASWSSSSLRVTELLSSVGITIV